MNVAEHELFPTKLLSIQFPDVDGLNRELVDLFAGRAEFRDGDFNMHPDAFNLLDLADAHPCVGQLREMFLAGLRRWLRAEGVRGDFDVSMVLFSNWSRQGDFTVVHNHNADVAAVYYVRTADYDRPGVRFPDPAGEYDYFDADDGVLILHDPRFNANLAALQAKDYVKVFPTAGQMVLFPGYLWHSVTPHRGEYRRLSVAANFRVSAPETRRACTQSIRLP